MNISPSSNFPISDKDQTEIIRIFIELMRQRDLVAQADAASSGSPLSKPSGGLQDI